MAKMRKVLSLFLVLLFCLSLLPVGVMAEEAGEEPAISAAAGLLAAVESVTAEVTADQLASDGEPIADDLVLEDPVGAEENEENEGAGHTEIVGMDPGVSIAERFPDEAFRAFVTKNYDTDGNGVLSSQEIDAVTEIACQEQGIASLEGIEVFRALTMLWCNANQLTELDVSANTELVHLDCSVNDLTELNVSANEKLEYLNCDYNRLTALDMSANTALTRLDFAAQEVSVTFEQVQDAYAVDMSELVGKENLSNISWVAGAVYDSETGLVELTANQTSFSYGYDTGAEDTVAGDMSVTVYVSHPKAVENGAFGTCGDLTWKLDGGVLTISGKGDMPAMEEYDAPWEDYRDRIQKVVIEKGVTSIGDYAFSNCVRLYEVEMADTVKTVGRYAFAWCWQLGQMELSTGVETIGEYAFAFNSMTMLTIHKSLATLGNYVFEGSELRYILYTGSEKEWEAVISGTEQWFGDTTVVFDYVPGTPVELESGQSDGISWSLDNEGLLTVSGEGAMSGSAPWSRYRTYITSVVVEPGVTALSANAFINMSNLTQVSLPNTVTAIEYGTFMRCTSLTQVDIPESVVSIGESAFEYTGLTSVEIPGSVSEIAYGAFKNCESLVDVEIAEGLVSIGESAFSGCVSMTEITLPASLQQIENAAFSYCLTLGDVYYGGTAVQWGEIVICEGNGFLLNAKLHMEEMEVSSDTEENEQALKKTLEVIKEFSENDAEVTVKVVEHREGALKEALEDENVKLTTETRVEILHETQLTQAETSAFQMLAEETDGEKECAVVTLLDVNVSLKADGEEIGTIAETAEELEFCITLTDEDLKRMGVAIEDVYIVRIHDGKAERLETYTKEGVPNKVFFKSAKFSVYAIMFDYILGDVNNSGDVTAVDLVSAMKFLTGDTISVVKKAADVNGDGVVDLLDVVTLLKKLSSKTVS